MRYNRKQGGTTIEVEPHVDETIGCSGDMYILQAKSSCFQVVGNPKP